MNNKIKVIENSEDSYDQIKVITEAAVEGSLKPWGKKVTDVLALYGVNINRKRGFKVQLNLSYPQSTVNKAIAIGVRHQKEDGTNAEDLFVFEEGVGLTCYYRGTQEKELPEYDSTHHAKVELSEFLPDLQEELDSLKRQIQSSRLFEDINIPDIMTESRFKTEIDDNTRAYAQDVRNVEVLTGSHSAAQQYSMKAQPKYTKLREAIRNKYFASNKLYDLKKAQLTDLYAGDENKLKAAIKQLNDLFERTDD